MAAMYNELGDHKCMTSPVIRLSIIISNLFVKLVLSQLWPSYDAIILFIHHTMASQKKQFSCNCSTFEFWSLLVFFCLCCGTEFIRVWIRSNGPMINC